MHASSESISQTTNIHVDAVEQGLIKSSDYLISIMGGLEIWAGGEGASIDSFKTDVK